MSGDESLGRLPAGGWVPAGGRAGAAADHGVCCRTLASSACSSRPGSSPSSSARMSRTRPYAASASAWRPLRYSAVISVCQRPSRSGCSWTSASSCPVTSPPAPSSTRAAKWSSSSPRRISSRRARCGCSQGPSPASTSTSPRKSASASPDNSAAPARSPPCRRSLAVVARVTTRSASTRPGSTSRAYPPGPLVITPGTPRARRSWDTFDCSVFRPVVAATSAHRSSMSRSGRTGAPASIASRTSTSVVFPDGSGSTAPSRRTSTGPSTAILSILAV